jgi:methyltransferase (TIGR00027 family)
LLVDHDPWILEDTLAVALLGDLADDLIASHRGARTAEVLGSMRVAMATRSRYAEDRLAEAMHRGIEQCVLLGAGLDSFAYRSRLAHQLRVFEVDHPATQAWKRGRLVAASIPVSDEVRFVPVDFSIDSLSERLSGMGFDRSRPAFVTWLGVSQYLTAEAIATTLEDIGGFCSGTELVMEYLLPGELRDVAGQALADFFMPRAAASGEPWLTFITQADVSGLLAARGMVVIDDVGRRDQINASLWERSDGLRPHELGRVVRAAVAT